MEKNLYNEMKSKFKYVYDFLDDSILALLHILRPISHSGKEKCTAIACLFHTRWYMYVFMACI